MGLLLAGIACFSWGIFSDSLARVVGGIAVMFFALLGLEDL